MVIDTKYKTLHCGLTRLNLGMNNIRTKIKKEWYKVFSFGSADSIGLLKFAYNWKNKNEFLQYLEWILVNMENKQNKSKRVNYGFFYCLFSIPFDVGSMFTINTNKNLPNIDRMDDIIFYLLNNNYKINEGAYCPAIDVLYDLIENCLGSTNVDFIKKCINGKEKSDRYKNYGLIVKKIIKNLTQLIKNSCTGTSTEVDASFKKQVSSYGHNAAHLQSLGLIESCLECKFRQSIL